MMFILTREELDRAAKGPANLKEFTERLTAYHARKAEHLGACVDRAIQRTADEFAGAASSFSAASFERRDPRFAIQLFQKGVQTYTEAFHKEFTEEPPTWIETPPTP